MSYQMTFKRYEMKYMLTEKQKEELVEEMENYMKLDKFGMTTIRSIYFDTDSYRLIRTSLEKPEYKEKLRLRGYARANADSEVFVELKKKFESIVYKRRIVLPEREAMDWLCGEAEPPVKNQIEAEIEYFRYFYGNLSPKIFLSYDREAYYSLGGDDFRVTFDENILGRDKDISLESGVWGTQLLEKGTVLMEIKTSGGIPLWMAHFLSEHGIYKTHFSKYGEAYENILMKKHSGGQIYA